MKHQKAHILHASRKSINPFIKLMKDMERIEKAIKDHGSLASLKDIKFVKPI